MSKQTVLLTGATGFLGSHLLEALIEQGYSVVVLKRSTSNLWRIEHLVGQYKSYDVDTQPIEQVFEEQRINGVIHTACHYGRNGDSVSQIVESNLMFGLRVLDACLKFEVDTFINTDTFFNNKNFKQKYLRNYTLSKKQFVEWTKLASEKIQVINLKLQHIYGPKDAESKFIPWVISQLKQNVNEIKLTSGQQKRDFIYISDVVNAFLIVLEKKSMCGKYIEFDVGSGQIQTLADFLNQLKSTYSHHNLESKTKLMFGAIQDRKDEIMNVEVDNTGLVKLGWEPKISPKSAFKMMIEY